MSVLCYRTRASTSPQGKPRVYFCCHPQEHGCYLDAIAETVLARQDCALWYLEDPESDRDDTFWSDLSQMQLFVLPVTTRLRTSDNAALEEFRFAIDSHIPVLPLMQEEGLAELFNAKCGKLQYLDPNARDETAISYEEKLEKYLSSVLVGDDLAQKVRAAFDAYVFLSYRKKDRRYAQELMRLIHQNEFCRDIAIWYDEFLTPGENFNESIREALQKSQLFVMAVTPNLVCETNYIMTTEYPMARNAGKPILPAELVPTDRAQLAEKYEALPLCTNAYDASALSEALLSNLQKLAIRENDSDPQHNFFIGLAYLSGIDVEVNYDRALALITSAAEAGLVAAADKLVNMYRTGLGVARNYITAIRWQTHKATLLARQYEQNPKENRLITLFWALITCGDYWKELGKLSQAAAQYEAAQARLEAYPERSNRVLRNLSAAGNRLGSIHKAEGDLAAARACFHRSLIMDEQMLQEVQTEQARRDLTVSLNKMGSICKAEGDLAAAREYYQRALALREAMVLESGTAEARRDLSVSYNNLWEICKAEGDLATAREYAEKALTIRQALAKDVGTPAARRDLTISLNNMCELSMDEGDLDNAREYAQKALAIRERLAAETGTIEARRDLTVSCNNLGRICKKEGDLDTAREYYLRALTIRRALAEETGTLSARSDLSNSFHNMGILENAAKAPEAALAYYQQAYAIREKLADSYDTIDILRGFSRTSGNLARQYKILGDTAAAIGCYRRCAAVRETLAARLDTAKAWEDLVLIYHQLAQLDTENAAASLRRAEEIYEALLGRYPDNKTYQSKLTSVREKLQPQ